MLLEHLQMHNPFFLLRKLLLPMFLSSNQHHSKVEESAQNTSNLRGKPLVIPQALPRIVLP
jgi:hypothetical protein